ncbi:MAG TPA: alpha/beta fold hydrolase [Thermoanaerobaculia bacterium]|nr:alpha/beta fold hydrolase [Thermoanaerobaculia bacterium]
MNTARLAFGVLGHVAPGLAAAAAERLFFTPVGSRRRSRGEAQLAEAERFSVPFAGGRLAAWRWGRGPAVLLLHGWAGQAAQLTSLVPPLVARGYSVAAFDAPGHGRSGRGLSSLPQFARALSAVAERVGPVSAIVAHSMGAAAAALAHREGLAVERMVFLAPAADPPSWIAQQAGVFGIGPRVVQRLRSRSERRLGFGWHELNVPAMAPQLSAGLLVIHDRGDAEVPFSDGAAVAGAWPGAELVETRGLGHNRILRDPEVMRRTVEFLGEPTAVCPCGATAAGRCRACGFDRELWDREVRRARIG